MKIWILTSEMPWFNPGGIARYVDNFAGYLAADGHEVCVFGPGEEEGPRTLEAGYRYVPIVPRWHLCGKPCDSPRPDDHPAFPYNLLDYWGAFSYQAAGAVQAEIALTGPPDVIESQEYAALPYYLLQRKLTEPGPLADVPVVVNAHSPEFLCREYDEDPRYQFPHYWTGRLEMFCLHAADSVICPSQYLSRQLEERFGGSIRVQPHPLPWTDPRRHSGGEPVDSRRVLCFGRLEVRKGTLKLVAACERLWQRGEDFVLQLVGSDTSYFPRGTTVGKWIREKYAKWIESGRLRIEEALPFGELMREVRTAAFTVIPSIWENWPNTCIEAMSQGKVVVASRHGGQAEMIGDDGRCGFLFSWDEDGSFEQAFSRALRLGGEERRTMGRAAAGRIAGLCRPDKVLEARLEHFRTVVRKAGRRARFPFVNRRLRDSRAREQWPDTDGKAGRVTILVPHYNLGAYLEETVDSALAADWPDKEVLVIDDGSDDPASLEALDRITAREDPLIRVFRQENAGLAAARNAGAELATGEYLLLLDADDLLEPAFIKRALYVLRRYENVHVVYCWERYFEASDDIYPCWNFEFPYLLAHNMTCPVSLLYRKSYLAFGPSNLEMAYNFEDFELWISLVKKGCGGVALPDPLCRYRIRSNSMWQGSNRDQHLFLQDRITRLHPELFREYGVELFNLQNANGSAQKWIKPSARSPFDEFEQWSRRRIGNLEKEAEKWWRHSVGVEERLQASEEAKHALWLEKNRLEEALQARLGEGHPPAT